LKKNGGVMKMFFIFILFFSVALLRATDTEEKDVSNAGRLEELQEDRKSIELKMHKLRIKLIKETPDLMELHKKIMALHKELAIRIDKNKEMKELIKTYKKINNEILKTKRKSKAAIREEKKDDEKTE
jgi:hypothetical protein